MGRPSKYPQELRERAVRMVAEVQSDYDSQWAAMEAVAKLLGVGSTETIRSWVRRSEVNAGSRPGVTTDAAAELARLKLRVHDQIWFAERHDQGTSRATTSLHTSASVTRPRSSAFTRS